ncbi:hypothetical protein M758_6G101100 [Ceratodon purpureus]|uniref:Translation elongation factor EF1B beta/delta subunit guanine nucleotide exchange domain-containing protein n=1 Tax=Ceratodon purpureus TaxID=3225 RepID=A0A8T0HIP6_CERPU|nr:hypothetical protein KC19_6G104900 [Ceratodon purpureus]KAG0613417.1 hypothetical protein M758_6G101100 [Ceratodon purpureus]
MENICVASAVPQSSSSNQECNNEFDLLNKDIVDENLTLSSCNALKNLSVKDHSTKKSLVKLHITPWDDQNHLKEVENHVRGIHMDGLFWGGSQSVVADSGARALEITMTIEAQKVSPSELIENILGDDPCSNLIKSVDIVSFDII